MRGGWLALAGAVILLTPLVAQPVSQPGPIDPGSQTLAQPKPAPPKPAAQDGKAQKKTQAATGQTGNASAPGSSTQSWSTRSAAQRDAKAEGTSTSRPGPSAQSTAPQSWSTQSAAQRDAAAQSASTPGGAMQGWPTQGASPQNKTPAPAAQAPLRPDADGQKGTADDTPVFRSDVRLVRMLATVRDSGGALAGGLKREEFRIVDSGVPQELAVFEATTEQPLSVAILIDCSASTYRAKRTELDSVRAFARSLFAGGNAADSMALYSFNAVVTQETAWTRSAERVERALARLQSDGATSLYDAIALSAHDLAVRSGRHVSIVVTDGGDTFSKNNYQQALEAAHAADAILYAVIIVPVAEDPGRNTGGEHALISMAASTGGRAFLPGTQKELDEAFGEILRDLRTQYLLGYYPHGVASTRDRFHEVKLALARPGYTVSSRSGYFEPAPGKGSQATPR